MAWQQLRPCLAARCQRLPRASNKGRLPHGLPHGSSPGMPPSALFVTAGGELTVGRHRLVAATVNSMSTHAAAMLWYAPRHRVAPCMPHHPLFTTHLPCLTGLPLAALRTRRPRLLLLTRQVPSLGRTDCACIVPPDVRPRSRLAAPRPFPRPWAMLPILPRCARTRALLLLRPSAEALDVHGHELGQHVRNPLRTGGAHLRGPAAATAVGLSARTTASATHP